MTATSFMLEGSATLMLFLSGELDEAGASKAHEAAFFIAMASMFLPIIEKVRWTACAHTPQGPCAVPWKYLPSPLGSNTKLGPQMGMHAYVCVCLTLDPHTSPARYHTEFHLVQTSLTETRRVTMRSSCSSP